MISSWRAISRAPLRMDASSISSSSKVARAVRAVSEVEKPGWPSIQRMRAHLPGFTGTPVCDEFGCAIQFRRQTSVEVCDLGDFHWQESRLGGPSHEGARGRARQATVRQGLATGTPRKGARTFVVRATQRCQKSMPPPAGTGGAASFLGLSAIRASVVISSEATDAASCSAVRTTLAGSITPFATRS